MSLSYEDQAFLYEWGDWAVKYTIVGWLGVIWYTVPIYFVMLFCMIRYRNTTLNSSFFHIHISLCISDILCACWRMAMIFGQDYEYDEYLINGPGLDGRQQNQVCEKYSSDSFQGHLILMYISDYYLYYVNLFTVLLLSVNRYTALVHPFSFEQIWSKKRVWSCVIGTWLIPLPMLTSILIAPRLESNGNKVRRAFFSEPKWMYDLYSFIQAIEPAVFLPTFIFLYWKMFSVLKKTEENSQSTSNKKSLHTERRLALVGVVLTLLNASSIIVRAWYYWTVYAGMIENRPKPGDWTLKEYSLTLAILRTYSVQIASLSTNLLFNLVNPLLLIMFSGAFCRFSVLTYLATMRKTFISTVTLGATSNSVSVTGTAKKMATTRNTAKSTNAK